MNTRITTFIHQPNKSILRLGLLSTLAAAARFSAGGQATSNFQHPQPSSLPSKLVLTVRESTQQFVDVNAATAAGYKPFLGCITGPDMGAMGVHYVNADLVNGGEMNATEPQALIYEPSASGMRLVGVEFIALSVPWLAHNPAPPVLEKPELSVHRYSQPLRPAGTVRATRVGVAGQPQRSFRGLEHARDMRKGIDRGPTRWIPVMGQKRARVHGWHGSSS